MDLLIYLAGFVALMSIGSIVGSVLESAHYRSIKQRENRFRSVPIVTTKRAPDDNSPSATYLVTGNAVISVDYFKRFIASLRKLVGGNLSTYETLVDRARRESLLRMQEQAEALGASLVINVRMETSSVSKGGKEGTGMIGSVEVLAYGTALIPAKPASSLP